ncbi:unnamed protein product [Gongylonema pulchrum]|uniref:Thioesterase domain-containing protein n=1 Tax=Gongylonema pulchrum TaxID=637853 RepID=A0A183EGW4_9BILA|nr:unnamed protein product [Gongylonema pulchrum]
MGKEWKLTRALQVHCMYGYGLETPETFEWSKIWFPDYQPTTYYGDGDGSVNRRSLEACRKWIGNNGGKQVKLYALERAEHMDILQHKDVIALIKSLAAGEKS